ncbi:hypothetical protein FQA39_LY14877 [Lamprigera yunnana]|nr:hypothetical protein FQA39_LY14877 [Lamprigera yunnana]
MRDWSLSENTRSSEKTEIRPTNANVFTEANFLPSETTNISMVEALNAISPDRPNPSNVPDTLTPTAGPKSPTDRPSSAERTPEKQPESRPGCSWMADPMPANPCASPQPSCSKFPYASPENILLVLNVKPGQKRKQGKTAIITASLYKAELEQLAFLTLK